MARKYLRFLKDGYVIAYNSDLEANAAYEVFEEEDGVDPQPADFRAPPAPIEEVVEPVDPVEPPAVKRQGKK